MKKKFDKKIASDNLDKKKKARKKRQAKPHFYWPAPAETINHQIFIGSLMFKKSEIESVSKFSYHREMNNSYPGIYIPGPMRYDNIVVKVYIGPIKFKKLFKLFTSQKEISMQINHKIKDREVRWQIHGLLSSITNKETHWSDGKDLVEFEMIPDTIIKLNDI